VIVINTGLFRFSALTTIAWLIFIMPLAAQETPLPSQFPEPSVKARTWVTGEDQRLMAARRLINNRDYESAVSLLEVINDSLPNNPVIETLLLRCYEYLGQYARAEQLARKMLIAAPGGLTFRLKLAELLAKQEKLDEAVAVYSETLTTLKPDDKGTLSLVLSSMLNNGVEVEAFRLIDSLRLIRDDKSLFGLERGRAYEQQKRYQEAAGEYNKVLAYDTTRTAMQAESRLLELLKFVETEPVVVEVLTLENTETDNRRAIRLLAAHFIGSEQYDRGFTLSLKQDTIDDFDGRALMYFMRQCTERQYPLQVIRMGEYILAQARPELASGEMYRLLGEAYTETAQFTKAIASFNRIIAKTPAETLVAEALAQNGYIYLYGLKDCDSALLCFDSVVNHYPQGYGYLSALRGIPLARLGQGDIAAARRDFKALAGRHLNPDLKEEVAYYLAALDFIEHRFATAETAFRKLMVDYPRGLFVNDALELLMVLNEAEEDSSLMVDFATAWLFEIKRESEPAARQWELMAEKEESALADNALFRWTQLELERGDTLQADICLDRLLDDFPDSYYRPWGLHTRGDLLVVTEKGLPLAQEIYRQLLETYPNYPFASEIREKLRNLEPAKPVG